MCSSNLPFSPITQTSACARCIVCINRFRKAAVAGSSSRTEPSRLQFNSSTLSINVNRGFVYNAWTRRSQRDTSSVHNALLPLDVRSAVRIPDTNEFIVLIAPTNTSAILNIFIDYGLDNSLFYVLCLSNDGSSDFNLLLAPSLSKTFDGVLGKKLGLQTLSATCQRISYLNGSSESSTSASSSGSTPVCIERWSAQTSHAREFRYLLRCSFQAPKDTWLVDGTGRLLFELQHLFAFMGAQLLAVSRPSKFLKKENTATQPSTIKHHCIKYTLCC